MPEGTVMKAIVQDTYGSRHRGVPGAGCRPPGTIPRLTGGGVHVRACGHCARRRHGRDRRLAAKPGQTEGDERMSTAASHTAGASHSSSVPPVGETSYLSCPEGRIGYDVAGAGSLAVLVPGMGDLRAGYRFLAPALRAAGYRVACTDLRGHGDSDTTFTSYGDEETAGDVLALIGELGGPAVVAGNSTTRTSHDPAQARLADVTAPALVVMASRTRTSPTRGPELTGSPAPCGHRS
jgi:hypothetical protein